MKPELTLQLIETGGLILAPLLTVLATYCALKRLVRLRERFDCEAQLLEHALFYRAVIGKYAAFCGSHESIQKQFKNDFWAQAKNELGVISLDRTEPAEIKRRLQELNLMSEKVQTVIDKIP